MRNNKKPVQAKPLSMQALEQRFLLDAAIASTLADASLDANSSPDLDNALQQLPSQNDVDRRTQSTNAEDIDFLEHGPLPQSNEIVFIDRQVSDVDEILKEISRSAAVYFIDSASDGIEQVGQVLAGYTNVESVHILSHGGESAIQLGSTIITPENLAEHEAQLGTWSNGLSDNADILFYGCEVGADHEGQAFIESISSITGADIAASSDDTGAASLGGDWDLEIEVGSIERQALSVTDFPDLLDLRPSVDIDADDSGINPGTFATPAVTMIDGANFNGTLGDGATVSTNFTVERTVLLGVSPDILVDLVDGADNAIEITIQDDATSPEATEGARIVTNFTPNPNTNITQLTLAPSPDQNLLRIRRTKYLRCQRVRLTRLPAALRVG